MPILFEDACFANQGSGRGYYEIRSAIAGREPWRMGEQEAKTMTLTCTVYSVYLCFRIIECTSYYFH